MLAREWIVTNAPCKVQDYLREVSPMMPTHIVRKGDGVRISQEYLARDALRRYGYDVNGEMIEALPRPVPMYDHLATIAANASEDGLIELKYLGSAKQTDAFREWIKRRSTCVGPRKYLINAETLKQVRDRR